MEQVLYKSDPCLLADVYRFSGLDYDKSYCDFSGALGAAKSAPDSYLAPCLLLRDTHRAHFFALTSRPLGPTPGNAPGRGSQHAGCRITKPSSVSRLGQSWAAKKGSPGFNCIMGMCSRDVAGLKPVRFSMVRCPKRSRAKLRTPSPRPRVLSQFAPINRCILPQPGTNPASHQARP